MMKMFGIKEGDKFSILDGQVAITVGYPYGIDNISFTVDAVGEEEIQRIETTSGKRATFSYDGKRYVINIEDYLDSDLFEDDEIKISIAEVKK